MALEAGNRSAGSTSVRSLYDKNLAGAPGKTTCLLVKLQMAPQGLEAEPVFGKSGLISTMAEADGYVLIDMNQEGLKKGEQVKVYRF